MSIEDSIGRGRRFSEEIGFGSQPLRKQRQGFLGPLVDGRFGGRVVDRAAGSGNDNRVNQSLPSYFCLQPSAKDQGIT